MTTIKWCCPSFQSHYDIPQPGSRGVTLLIGRGVYDRFAVVLQFRSVNLEMEKRIPFTEEPITVCTDLQILRCPWCGKDLKAHYERWLDLLERPGFLLKWSD